MAERLFDLYIDESGSFQDDIPEEMMHPEEMSLVGGILCDPAVLTDEHIDELLPGKVHCREGYKKYYIDVLETCFREGSRFIIFENKERIKVLNGDVTYLNIISEGLVQLLSDLPLEYPDDHVKVHIVVATRKDVSAGRGIIKSDEYKTRLTEKIIMALHRSKAAACDYELEFADARFSKRHDFADIVCNTYMTRNRKRKFTDEERMRINAVYDKKYIYSVFQDATAGYLKQLLAEARYSEMMYQICTLTKLQGVTELRNKLLMQVIRSSSTEREAYFRYISLQIGLYNERGRYAEGICFAENYKRCILYRLADSQEIGKRETDFWIFDTDFYILTMYDHIGNASMCEKYTDECRKNIQAINHSWEHLDYYFKYRIRELNCLMGRFDFDAVIEKAKNLIEIFTSAKELFSMIETYDGTANMLRSELLGKAYGVQLEAYNNQLYGHPELFEQALNASNNAIAEFSTAMDLQRQYQYRCSLMVHAGKAGESLKSLFKSYELDPEEENADCNFVTFAYRKQTGADVFALWHYTNVMLCLGQAGAPRGAAMFKSLAGHSMFAEDLKKQEKDGYPWNMVIWNISRWYRMNGSPVVADNYYRQALGMTRKHPEQITMYSFSISMVADFLLWNLNKGRMTSVQVKNEMNKTLNGFMKLPMPESMQEHFKIIDSQKIEEQLDYLSHAYLK